MEKTKESTEVLLWVMRFQYDRSQSKVDFSLCFFLLCSLNWKPIHMGQWMGIFILKIVFVVFWGFFVLLLGECNRLFISLRKVHPILNKTLFILTFKLLWNKIVAVNTFRMTLRKSFFFFLIPCGCDTLLLGKAREGVIWSLSHIW